MPARWHRRVLAPIVASLVLAAAALPALAAGAGPAGRGDRASVDTLALERLERRGSVDVLVTLDGASALARARASARGDSTALLRQTVPAYRSLKTGVLGRVEGVRVLRDYSALPVLLVRVGSRAALERLARDPAVVGIGADRRERATLSQSLPLIGQPTAAAAGHTGAGVGVAVLDTGMNYNHPAFGTCGGGPGSPGCRVVFAQDFAPDDGQLDDNGHGTNVGGIVAGVAPDASLLAMDVFTGGGAFVSDQVSAINHTITKQATYNIHAMNMSLGALNQYNTSQCSDPSDARVAAFSNARAAGILPVIAAGNNRFSNSANHVGVSRPACIPGAFVVGAVYDSNVGGLAWGSPPNQCSDPTTAADQITCFSQTWNNSLLLGPGALINAAGLTMGGTSQATPHVAGGVAVLYDAAPGSALTAVEAALLNSGPLIFDGLVGQSFHRLDLPAAVAALGPAPPPPPPPPGAPTVTAFTPTKGIVGDTVIITGTAFTGSTGVTFDGVPAAFTVDLDTQITATVPGGASTGPIAVTTAGGTGTSATNFVVQHRRTASLHFSSARGNVTVDDGFNECRSGAPLKLQRRVDGRWRTVDTGSTNPNGSYNLGPQAPGRYRIVAKAFTTPGGDRCLKDTSPPATN